MGIDVCHRCVPFHPFCLPMRRNYGKCSFYSLHATKYKRNNVNLTFCPNHNVRHEKVGNYAQKIVSSVGMFLSITAINKSTPFLARTTTYITVVGTWLDDVRKNLKYNNAPARETPINLQR